jgi:ubiquitin C-terminal hydrolase
MSQQPNEHAAPVGANGADTPMPDIIDLTAPTTNQTTSANVGGVSDEVQMEIDEWKEVIKQSRDHLASVEEAGIAVILEKWVKKGGVKKKQPGKDTEPDNGKEDEPAQKEKEADDAKKAAKDAKKKTKNDDEEAKKKNKKKGDDAPDNNKKPGDDDGSDSDPKSGPGGGAVPAPAQTQKAKEGAKQTGKRPHSDVEDGQSDQEDGEPPTKKPRPETEENAEDENEDNNDESEEDPEGRAIREALNSRAICRQLNKPIGIRKDRFECFAISTMQCLAAVVEPNWLKQSLGTHLQTLSGIWPVFDDLFTVLARVQSGSQAGFVEPIKNMLENLQDVTRKGVNMDGNQQQCPAEFFEYLIDVLKTGPLLKDGYIVPPHRLIKPLFWVDSSDTWECLGCKHQRSKLQTGNYFFTLAVEQGPKTLNDLFQDKKNDISETTGACDACNEYESMNRLRWNGLEHLPDILIIQLNMFKSIYKEDKETRQKTFLRTEKQFVSIDMPEELDVAAYSANNNQTRTKYMLRAFIKHRGDDLHQGHYIGYVRQKEGSYWECDDQFVDLLTFDAAKGRKGETYMLFYERLP